MSKSLCFSWIPLWLLLAGCAKGPFVEMPKTTTAPMELSVGLDGEPLKWVRVTTEGKDTVLDFNGHVYVFRGRVGHSGRVELGKANLEIADLHVKVDSSGILVKGENFKIEADHLPGNERRIIDGMSLE